MARKTVCSYAPSAVRIGGTSFFPVLALIIGASLTSAALAEVKVSDFGKTADGTPVKQFTLTNSNGVIVKLISRGATPTDFHTPEKNGKMADVVFGFDDIAGYESAANQYYGCTTGRVANRIAGGKFSVDGKPYSVAINNGPNALHGGVKRSLDKVVWNGNPFTNKDGEGVVFTYYSFDGEEGYPG
jgi:aldose 1-epimerase